MESRRDAVLLSRRTVVGAGAAVGLASATRAASRERLITATIFGPVRGYRDRDILVFKGVRYGADTGPAVSSGLGRPPPGRRRGPLA